MGIIVVSCQRRASLGNCSVAAVRVKPFISWAMGCDAITTDSTESLSVFKHQSHQWNTKRHVLLIEGFILITV